MEQVEEVQCDAYLRKDNDYVSVPVKDKSRLVGCGNFEGTEGLRTDSLVMWIRTTLFGFGVLRLTSPFTHAISRMDTFKDKKLIESCCVAFQLKVSQKKELQAEKFWPHVFPSTAQKMQGEDCGFD